MTDDDVKELYEFYTKEVIRLFKISDRTRKLRVKSKLFDRAMRLKDKYDWTFDELYRRGLLIPKS